MKDLVSKKHYSYKIHTLPTKKKLYSHFLWMEPRQVWSLLFTRKFPKIPVSHFTDLGRMKG